VSSGDVQSIALSTGQEGNIAMTLPTSKDLHDHPAHPRPYAEKRLTIPSTGAEPPGSGGTDHGQHRPSLPGAPGEPSSALAALSDAEAIVRRYACRIYNLARRLLGNEADAEGVTQEALVQRVRELDTSRGESEPAGWLHRVTVNAALVHRRRLASEACAPPRHLADRGRPVSPPAEAGPDAQRTDREVCARVEAAVRGLPEKYRDPFVLSDIEGLTSAQVGGLLGLSVPVVKSRLHWARLLLRDALKPCSEPSETLEAHLGGCADCQRDLGTLSDGEDVIRWRRLLELDGKLPAVLRGEVRPADAGECLGLARVCGAKGLYAAAARYYREAFALRPEWATDLGQGHRYQAACAAARASGGGEGAAAAGERAGWRRQARDWLRAHLRQLAAHRQWDGPGVEAEMRRVLRGWLREPALADVRDPERLAELSADEQGECRRLWEEVQAVLTSGPDRQG
jgi:RNA polymerase sigma-70 factor (ECF subfamily)